MTHYRERLWPSAWIYIALALIIPASLLVFLPINVWVGALVAAGLYLGCVGLVIVSTPTITVTDSWVTAGRSQLPLSAIGELNHYKETEATLERGQRLDARAWLLIRGWVGPVIKLEVVDETDPAPYWLISTRHPDAFAQAVEAARRKAS